MRAPLLLPLLQACLVDPSAWEDRRAELACSTRWFVDDDGDGFGGADAGTACRAPAGAVERSGDCDDAQTGVHPDAEETPGDGVDQDCDGGELCFEDGDGDGFGQPGTAAGGLACAAPGQSARSGDCDDRSQAV